jgi:Xaa-Pro dipeptidase
MSNKRTVTAGGHRLTMNTHKRLPFTLEEYQRRYDLVLDHMKQAKVDALLVRSPENITYLTGYETPGYYGYHCLIAARGEQPVLVGRELELTNVPEFSWLVRTAGVKDHQIPAETTNATLAKLGLARKKIGVEKSGWFFTVNEYEALQAGLPKATILDCSTVVEEARMIKSEAEVEMMRAAVRIADKACMAGLRATKAGTTEDIIAGALHKVWCEQGAEYTGLPNFIVSGRRSAACHATWRGRKLNKNDHCIFEIAASKNRYCGAVFRTATVGTVRPRMRRLFEATKEALEATIDTMKPGVPAEKADKAGRDVIKAHGFGKHHRHRLGYSIGVNYPPDWGEGQIISIRKGEKRELRENMTFHLVPGCLIAEDMGIVTSNSVRVTATGCEVLNTLPVKLYER